jgi:hypothetical protein
VQDTEIGKAALLFGHSTHLLILLLRDKDADGLLLPTIRLTSAGIQLMSLGSFAPSEDYLRSVGMFSRHQRRRPPSGGTLKAILAPGHLEKERFQPASEEVLFDDTDPASLQGPAT